jgi:EmrB/QacA subfamily drug resistance transporter
MLNASGAFDRWESEPTLRRRAWAAMSVAATSQFLYMLDAGVVALALPEIEQTFGDVSRATLGWVAGAFLVAQSSLLLVGGRLGDRHGRKRFFLFGLITFCIGGVLTAMAPTIWLLIAARTVQGAGAAFLTSGALALVLPMFPSLKSAVVIGAWGVVGAIGALATPLFGPFLVERSWRMAFFIVAPIGVVAVTLGRRLLVEPERDLSRGPTDRLSFVIGPPALGLTMLVVSRASRWGWTSNATLSTGAVAFTLLAAFLRRSAVSDAPLLDLDIFRNRWFAANVSAGFAQQMGFFAWYLTAPLIMHDVWGWSVREIGLALAATQVLALVGSPIGGQLVIRFGQTFPVVLGALIVVASQLWLILTARTESDPWVSYLPMALAFGFGCGTCGTVTTGAALAALPQRWLGAGNSVVQLIRRIGGALGVAFGISLLGEASGDELLGGARNVWLMVAILHAVVIAPLALAHGLGGNGSREESRSGAASRSTGRMA